MKKSFCYVLILVIFLFFGLTLVSSGEVPKYRGWGKGSKYNSFYNPNEYTRIKGIFESFKTVIPLEGMEPGLAMVILLKQNNKKVTVHLGPKPFTKFLRMAFKKGDIVKIKGVWAKINGKKVFIASKVRNGEYFEFKLRRTKDGIPYWTLSKEEIIKEKLEE